MLKGAEGWPWGFGPGCSPGDSLEMGQQGRFWHDVLTSAWFLLPRQYVFENAIGLQSGRLPAMERWCSGISFAEFRRQ